MNRSRKALFGATALVALSLPAYAAGAAPVADTPLVKSTAQQFAQRSELPAFYRASKPKKKKPKK